MIDEFFDRKIDQWSESIPRFIKPWHILAGNSALGWRLKLYGGAAMDKLRGAFSNIKNEDNINRFMEETAERNDAHMARIRLFFREQAVWIPRLEAWSRTIRFCAALLLLAMAVLGIAAAPVSAGQHGVYNGRSGMAMLAASLCMLWLSAAIESGYAPVSKGIRQAYLVSTALRTGAIALMLIYYLSSYIAQGVPSNIVLQCAMIIVLCIHAVLFFGLVLFNRRQPLFARALAGVTGVLPALTAAGAAALCASYLFRPWPLPACGVLSALGAILAFFGDELITIKNLGGIRLKYYSIWVCLLMTGGFTLMLLGAWMNTPIS